MAKKIALDVLIDGMEMQNDDVWAYLDRDTGEVVAIDVEISAAAKRDECTRMDWERELISIVHEVENGSERYVQLPKKSELREWELMRSFGESLEDVRQRDELLRQIRGQGAFRQFKGYLERRGLLELWFQYKRNVLRERAIEWCVENQIVFDSP